MDCSHLTFNEALRRISLLENTVDHLSAQLAESQAELGRLRDVRRLTIGETIRLALLRDLPVLRARYPEGVALRHLVEHFGFEKAITRLTISEMVRAGAVRWAKVKGSTEMILLLPGEEPPSGPQSIRLTRSHARTLDLLRQRAEDGVVRLSMNALAAETGIHASTLNYNVACLLRAERLFLVERGIGGRGSVYTFERPADPLTASPSLQRRIGEVVPYARFQQPMTTGTPLLVAPQETPTTRVPAICSGPRIPDNMKIEKRRAAVVPRATVTSRLLGDPTFARWDEPVAAPAPRGADSDGAWLQREFARLNDLD